MGRLLGRARAFDVALGADWLARPGPTAARVLSEARGGR
jgi:hypothetical protein